MASTITASAGPALTVTEDGSALDDLCKDLAREQLAPLWTQVGDLMPGQPTPKARRPLAPRVLGKNCGQDPAADEGNGAHALARFLRLRGAIERLR